jgi:hypothetical protein
VYIWFCHVAVVLERVWQTFERWLCSKNCEIQSLVEKQELATAETTMFRVISDINDFDSVFVSKSLWTSCFG